MKTFAPARISVCLAAGLTLGLLGVSADAAIIALDPDDTQSGITTATTLLADEGVAAPSAGGNDNLWGFSNSNTQANLGTGETASLAGEVWVSRDDLGENPPLLTTVISGLDSNTSYNVYLYYVTATGNNWGLQAGATGGSLTLYDLSNGTSVDTSGDGATQLRRALVLSDVDPTLAGTLSLDVDDSSATTGTVRGFYKGVGVEVVPEPSSLALLAAGAGLIAFRRRG
jgi:hypothetical protein